MQRLKGAIDSRIAEEQARQRAAVQSTSPSRSGSTSARRSLSRNLSPSKRPRQSRKPDLPTEKGPDPNDFDSDFAAGDESANGGMSNHDVPERNTNTEGQNSEEGGLSGAVNETGSAMDNDEAKKPAQPSGELSTEVRVKLRKLERLENKYQELLKAYRIAHARVQTIEPFEASLRENTPLTSINDPGALLEYLNQITLKGDMVVDELKRVATERDEYRKKFDESERMTQALRDEISNLKQTDRSLDAATAQALSPRQSHDLSHPKDATSGTAVETTPSVKSPTPSTSSRIPSFSLFSPKSKAVKSPLVGKETNEEFFSYDSELPRLEAELQERQTEIAELTKQVSTLQGDLSVTRESTEGMAQSLEAATRELHALRDANEKHESVRKELQIQIEDLEQRNSSLTSQGTAVSQEDSSLRTQMVELKVALEEKESALSSTKLAEEEKKAQLTSLERDLAELAEKVAQKDAIVKDLEDSLAMAQSAERQQTVQSRSESASQKQIGILNNIMESLRSQLKVAEGEIMELKEVNRKANIEIEDLLELKAHNDLQEEARRKLSDAALDRYMAHIAEQPSTTYFGFVNSDEFSLTGDAPEAFQQFSKIVKATRPELYEALISPEKSTEKSMATPDVQAALNDTTKKSKKKKKKNKAGQGLVAYQTAHDPPAKVTETLDEVENNAQPSKVAQEAATQHFQEQIKDLETKIQEKNATIERLSAKLRDQESLNEEIETLRDDLLHQGEEHVEARDALKAARLEKSALEECMGGMEKELAEYKALSAAGSAESEKAHEDLLSELEELKTKSGALQRDLTAAEQLAAARFKDITDLREVLSKAQPELRSLRSEVEDLRSTKEDLKNKVGELTRLESRHEDLKADMKNLSRKIGEKDTEIKDLRQRVADSSDAKFKVEGDLRTARSDLQNAKAARDIALNSQKQTTDELHKARADFSTSRSKIHELEEALNKHTKEIESLKEEIGLKDSLHNSTQAIVAGLREQTLELSTQAREATSRADGLEEELAEAQRMLSERSREGETMRRLLADVEGRTSTKIREMKERMGTAIEERDRVEDEASTSNRRMAREVEDLRNKAREVTRSLKAVEDEKEELERSTKDLKRRRDELEGAEEKARAEVAEVQAVMQQLREALDQQERENMDLERQKADIKRTLDEVQERMDRLQKANKTLVDELKTLQQRKGTSLPQPRAGGIESEAQSVRSSLDSSTPNPPPRNNSIVGSPGPNIRDRLPPNSRSSTPTGPNASPSAIDYVYLKNVLLQFLEQKDKNHQKQLIPVLGMLLNFDR